jgi:6-phosphogluconolactonase (cycloisomerase 2 family)
VSESDHFMFYRVGANSPGNSPGNNPAHTVDSHNINNNKQQQQLENKLANWTAPTVLEHHTYDEWLYKARTILCTTYHSYYIDVCSVWLGLVACMRTLHQLACHISVTYRNEMYTDSITLDNNVMHAYTVSLVKLLCSSAAFMIA